MFSNYNVCPDLEYLKPFMIQVLNNNDNSDSDIIKFREWISRCILYLLSVYR